VCDFVHGNVIAHYLFFAGALLLTYMMFGWFGVVIDESMRGLHSDQMDRTYRWGLHGLLYRRSRFLLFFLGHYCMLGNLRCCIGRKISTIFDTYFALAAIPSHLPYKKPQSTTISRANEVIPAFGLPALNTLLLLVVRRL